MRKIRVGVLVSGRGSNLQAIIDATKKKSFPAQVVLVISDNPKAYALKRASRAKIPTVVINRRSYSSARSFEGAIVHELKHAHVDLVCLAGFMRILSPFIVRAFRRRILNIHPALLPSFPGLHAQRQALEYGVKVSGVTVHFVDEGTDTGPIILQKAVPVFDRDTEETLSARILKWEHRLYPEAVRLVAEKKLRLSGRRVRFQSRVRAL